VLLLLPAAFSLLLLCAQLKLLHQLLHVNINQQHILLPTWDRPEGPCMSHKLQPRCEATCITNTTAAADFGPIT
jgi:hypothetical protein